MRSRGRVQWLPELQRHSWMFTHWQSTCAAKYLLLIRYFNTSRWNLFCLLLMDLLVTLDFYIMTESRSWAQHICCTKELISQRVQDERDLRKSLIHPCAQNSIRCKISKDSPGLSSVGRTSRDAECREPQAAYSCVWLSSQWKIFSFYPYILTAKHAEVTLHRLLSKCSLTSMHTDKPFILSAAYLVWHHLQLRSSCPGSMRSHLESLGVKK